MARYAVSREGLLALQQLRLDLVNATKDIDESGKQLFLTIADLSDGLGSYKKDIFKLLRQMEASNAPAREAVEVLAEGIIPAMMQRIGEELLAAFGYDTDDEDVPPQRKLVLRRRKW